MKDPKSLVPPNSKDSEMMVLGSMLTSVNSLNVGADTLDTQDFYYAEHQTIFDVLKAAYKNDKPADVHLVCEELKRIGKIKAVGGAGYITSLAQYAGTSAFIEEYVDVVQSKAVLRRMIQTAHQMEKEAFADPGDVNTLLDEVQQKLFAISQAAHPQGGVLVKDVLAGTKSLSKIPYLKELQTRQEDFQLKGDSDAAITGIPTHFIDLDKMLDGLGHSNLIILAARPAMGKTALALNIAENICFKNSLPVGIFSLEMSAEQLIHRLICSQAEVESEKLKTGSLSGAEFQKVVGCVSAMQKGIMVIDDQPGLKITDLRARARRMKETHSIQFLVVDYLQLLSGSGQSRFNENRQSEISEISRMLKNLARELDIPVLCLSQLSRKVEERPGHRPMMSDLRESGCLSHDALVEGADGTLYPIGELAKRKEQTPLLVKSVDVKSQTVVHSKMVKAFSSGVKVVFKLTTSSGKSIKASANHPFLKKDISPVWKRLDQLRTGDLIAIEENPSAREKLLQLKQIAVNKALGKEQKTAVIITPGLAFEQILSIEEIGEEEVFDATVEETHNFIANGLVVHNSIEQDSDIVTFLLRREYYDPYDKPGQAELIVAKNRHGSVGSVHLAYRKEYTQFGNYSGSPDSAPQGASDDAFAAFSPK